ncbi:alpha/beta hydrolase [Geitlerinema sp. PCC 9228]|jgi:pimeloyl-ACP methyl ester carboxylesterase|uniref:alpha/beta fold hydrolase n=1 Tax=Geitlerinema sp. PCC 9228 TaxID=111611 RepID=UPI0008F98AE3|nr:alpha/beta hydrolase [Geitlerinema sp. PCC 9228]
MSKIDIRGVVHKYELTQATPNASVLVFLHGWLLSSSYWESVVNQLSPHFQCLTYDLRGFGNSQSHHSSVEEDALGYTPAAYAEDLGILLDKLALSSVWLVGHSLGGSIALWAAAQFPQRVKGVICVNSGGGIYIQKEFERFRQAGAWMVRQRRWWWHYIPMLDLAFTRMNVVRPIARKWGKQRIVDFLNACPQAAVGALLQSTTEGEVHRLPHLVSQLQQPAYFIAGQGDTVMEPKYVRHLASFHPLFQNGKENTIELPDCGHLAMLEQSELLAREIRQIWQKHR